MQNVSISPTQLIKLKTDITKGVVDELAAILPGLLSKELSVIVSDKVEASVDKPMDMKQAAEWLGISYDTFKHQVADEQKAIPFHTKKMKGKKDKKSFFKRELRDYYLGKDAGISNCDSGTVPSGKTVQFFLQ